jgi:tetratricopeptide (TPR) repeat protein
MHRIASIPAVLIALWFFGVGAAYADPLLDQARALIDGNRGAEAYALLEPQAANRSGDPQFDLLLGSAAIDAGENTRAVFALERVLALEPGNARARAEMARAYLALGETDAARREFAIVKEHGVPPAVAANIEHLLSIADQFDDRTRPSFKAFVEAGVGIDSNISSSMGTANVAFPGMSGVLMTFGPAFMADGDNFTTLAAGLRYRNPLGGGVSFLAGGRIDQRVNATNHRFDTTSFDGNAGFQWDRDIDQFTLQAQTNTLWIESDRYRTANGFIGQWMRNLGPRDQGALYVQYAENYYPNQRLRDADRWTTGGSLGHAFDGGISAYAGAYVGFEKERADNMRNLRHSLNGLRFGTEWRRNDSETYFAQLTHERRSYHGIEPWPVMTRRVDTQVSLGLGMNWIPAKNWLVTPQVMTMHNDSNIAINEFHRETASVTVRRDF